MYEVNKIIAQVLHPWETLNMISFCLKYKGNFMHAHLLGRNFPTRQVKDTEGGTQNSIPALEDRMTAYEAQQLP